MLMQHNVFMIYFQKRQIILNSSSKMSSLGQLALTKPAPNFAGTAVVNADFKQIKLSDYKGKYLVLFFYPLDL